MNYFHLVMSRGNNNFREISFVWVGANRAKIGFKNRKLKPKFMTSKVHPITSGGVLMLFAEGECNKLSLRKKTHSPKRK